MGRIAGTDTEKAGYAAIAMAVGMSFADAWDLVDEIDSQFHPSGYALALAVERAALERTRRAPAQ